MRRSVARAVMAGVAMLAGMAAVLATGGPAREADAPLKAAFERWDRYVRDNTSNDAEWIQIKGSVQPALERVGQALRDGRPLLALVRFAGVQENLAAYEYMTSRPASARDAQGFEREWERTGRELTEYLSGNPPAGLAAIRSAAARAVAETAAAKVRVYYEASLDYGRNTAPQNGLFYLGAARAQLDVIELCRQVSAAEQASAPPLRSLLTELQALENDLLRAYRPPASVDRHSDFIAASATLKEARELDTLGLRYGALLRYVQAAVRVAALRGDPPPLLEGPAVAERIRELETRLSSDKTEASRDHSIARVLLEQARAETDAAPDHRSQAASAIVSNVVPGYFAALRPAVRAAPAAAARVTVTLVRWPYT